MKPYTMKDCGCYVDSARGWYATDAIVAFAESHGLEKVDWTNEELAYYEVEDEATDYMNEHYAVDGAYWGRNENGDWGLWDEEVWA